MNRGDTAYLMLNYTINGEPLVKDAYEEIELQLNSQTTSHSVKKLLTTGDIEWGMMTYVDYEGQSKEFEGYLCHLSQEETFNLKHGEVEAQLRILFGNDVGSSAISNFVLGQVLSNKVLLDPSE